MYDPYETEPPFATGKPAATAAEEDHSDVDRLRGPEVAE